MEPTEKARTESASADFSAEVRLGSVLVSLLEPHRGREVEFHRWYERDHFYSGCMVGPHFFAGRRFVATRPLKRERMPRHDSIFDDVDDGSYLTLYWLLAGHHREAERWSVDRIQSLIANGRMMSGCQVIHAGFYRRRFSSSRDPDGVPAELALDHPYAGVGLTFFETPSEGVRHDLLRELEERLLPKELPESEVSLCIGLTPMALPDDAPSHVAGPEAERCRILLLGFYASDPSVTHRSWSERLAASVEAEGLGRLELAASFIPTIPGTDRYADELW